MDNKSLENRKQFIITAVDKFYNAFAVLQEESLDVLKENAIKKYLNSNFTTTEILDDLRNMVLEKEKKVIERGEAKDARRRLITDIITSYYKNYDFLKKYNLSDLINKALTKYLDSELEDKEIVDELAAALVKMQSEYEEKHDEEKVRENHEQIYSKLDELVTLLNANNVDYYLAGALCGYIKYREESKRTHGDIDIVINENDLEKVKPIFSQMGLVFTDNRFNSPRVLKGGIPSGEHEVIANDPNSDFHIGMFPFERKIDGSMVVKGYYKDAANIPCCREERINSDFIDAIYEKTVFNGKPMGITAPEYVYTLKKYTNNDRDKEDIAFLEPRINVAKLDRIQSDKHNSIIIEHVSLPPKKDDNKISELDSMFDKPKDMPIEDNSKDKEKPKELVKKSESTNVSDNKGVVSIFSITMTILVVTAMVLVTMILLTLMK